MGSKGMRMWSGEGFTMRNCIVCNIHLIQIKEIEVANHVARMEEDRNAFKILTDTPTGKRPLGRPRHRWEDDVRMNLNKIGVNMRY